MAHAVLNILKSLFRKVPGCRWMQLRLGAFYDWDASLSGREFRAIEEHLSRCPDCASAWRDVCEARDAIERALIAADPARMSPELVAERAIARFETAGRKEARRVARRVAWASVSVAHVAAALLLIVAVPVLAYVTSQVWLASHRDEPPRQETIAIDTAAEEPAAISEKSRGQVPEEAGPPRPLSGPLKAAADDMLGKQLDEAIVKAEVEALLPHTEEEYEAWAREEYPHIMWLYDVLKEDFSWNGTWRQLLIDSGEIFRFDWPANIRAVNCKSRIRSVQMAAAVAGFSTEFGERGKFRLPKLEWVESENEPPIIDRAMDLHSAQEQVRPPIDFTDTIPEGYVDCLASDGILTKSVLLYLVVSAQVIDTPELRTCADEARELLSYAYTMREPITCANQSHLANRLRVLLEQHIGFRLQISSERHS